jgi:hypothetical protein
MWAKSGNTGYVIANSYPSASAVVIVPPGLIGNGQTSLLGKV